MAVLFFTEDVEEIKLPKRKISKWIQECITVFNKQTGEINLIFCSDEYLKEMNILYLKHDYYTDIITFNQNNGDRISGDIFISIDRVDDNSKKFEVDFDEELRRVIIHGILHLVGFDDTNEKLRSEMRKEEDKYLSKFEKY